MCSIVLSPPLEAAVEPRTAAVPLGLHVDAYATARRLVVPRDDGNAPGLRCAVPAGFPDDARHRVSSLEQHIELTVCFVADSSWSFIAAVGSAVRTRPFLTGRQHNASTGGT